MAGPGDESGWIGALAGAGAIAALVRADGTTVAQGRAARLGDLAGLARAASAAPVIVVVDGATVELRAVPLGGDLLLVGQDRSPERDLAALDELVSYGSHELKGPLHVLGLACHLIDARVRKGEKVDAAAVEQIRRQLARLTRQLNQILDVGRLRQRRLELAREPFDLAQAARASVAELPPPRVARVRFAGAGALPVTGDRTRSSEIVAELIDNALRFGADEAPVVVQLQGTAREGQVAVSDEGPGIPDGERSDLFELATALHTARRGRIGLGLGLHIARAIARQQGGDLDYAPAIPRGARFTLRVPR